MLLNRHGDALLRVKSILNVADAATPVAVQPAGYLMLPLSFFTGDRWFESLWGASVDPLPSLGSQRFSYF